MYAILGHISISHFVIVTGSAIRPIFHYTVSGKKEATIFSTTNLAFLGRFL